VLLPVDADLLALGVTAVSLVGTLVYLVRGGRLFWVVIGGGIMTVVFGAASAVTIGYSAQVIRVSGGTHRSADRQMLVGSKTVHVGGVDVDMTSRDTTTWIINDTDRPVVIKSAVYSELPGAPAPPRDSILEPYHVAPWPAHIDNLGPDDPLPTEVSSETSTTTKTWLTW
jgi:hypothetical protein